ncbi:S-adenosyl-L-methionine-dependent methyltransferase [Daldinia caldariorum]|uniref:S-adenosyl-L-methionine-dependent methyltransferase n=1 Tax=Daldinia caldariorum TaxID=326644 RepID=UPI002008480F|nr:S-adenosyl-L-methionine-dependent methyltransferase [Daldinia caldariorum]KAI1471585.1 S-adenosyl-L-methionine-dependent methyltransferase [Daldinia caldariorum]
MSCAESESGMGRRLGRKETSDDRAQLGASSNSASLSASCPSAVAATAAVGNSPREAVTPTGEQMAHHHQREGQHQRQVMHDDTAPNNSSTSTSSHGAAIRERQDRVSPTTAAPANYPGSSPNVGTDSVAAVAAGTSSAKDANAAESYEQQHVHSVYETIASHFSSTRHKPWPFVASFLESLAPGSVGLDVGCGNGKYLDVNRDIVIIGSDRSANLARLARDLKVVKGTTTTPTTPTNSGADVAGIADSLALPFGGARRRVDFAICIAVVHHLSTRERRVEGVRALLDCVRPRSGKVLVYVWALEQGTSRRGWDEGTADQDQLVPWVMKSNKPKKQKKAEEKEEASNKKEMEKENGESVGASTFQRYYHLYRKGELEEDVQAAGGEILSSGYEKDNWWVIASPRGEEERKQDCSPSIETR